MGNEMGEIYSSTISDMKNEEINPLIQPSSTINIDDQPSSHLSNQKNEEEGKRLEENL